MSDKRKKIAQFRKKRQFIAKNLKKSERKK